MFSLFLTWEVAFLLSGVFNFLIVNQWSIFSSSCFTVQILPKLFHFEHAALAHFDTHGRYVCVWCVCVFVVTTAGDNIDLFDLFLFWKHDLKLFLSVDHKHVLSSQAIAYFQHLNHNESVVAIALLKRNCGQIAQIIMTKNNVKCFFMKHTTVISLHSSSCNRSWLKLLFNAAIENMDSGREKERTISYRDREKLLP